jgi:hypothetical protein
MGTYRASRTLIVDAVQSAEAKTIASDLGFINVRQGDWSYAEKGGECYIVNERSEMGSSWESSCHRERSDGTFSASANP